MSTQAPAATTATPIEGTFNNSQENACIHVSTFFYLADCFYSRHNEEIMGQELPWTGPTVNPVYYPVDSPHAVPTYVPVPGDDRIAPPMTGELRIDDRGTDAPDDDLISGTLIVGPAARSVVVNVNELAGGPGGAPPRAVMTWTDIVHTLPASPVNTATPNDAGGFDYVIAARGFPERLCLTDDPTDCYPSARAGLTTDGQNAVGRWRGPAAVGVTRDAALENNPGTRTTAVINGYRCVDNRGDVTCPNHNVVWSPAEEPDPGVASFNEGPGLDNLLLRVITDAEHRVISAEGYWTNEYLIKGGPDFFNVPEGHDNSYQGGYMQMRGL
jgi:hypothetical protein